MQKFGFGDFKKVDVIQAELSFLLLTKEGKKEALLTGEPI